MRQHLASRLIVAAPAVCDAIQNGKTTLLFVNVVQGSTTLNMLEAQVLYYLNRYLGAYVKGLDPEALRISVFKGDLELRNLQLKPEALHKLKLPITVKAGLLGSLKLKVRSAFASCGGNQGLSGDSRTHPMYSASAASRSCAMQVPWANLGGAPVVVEMDRIYLLACPNSELQTQDDEVDQVLHAFLSARMQNKYVLSTRVAQCLRWQAPCTVRAGQGNRRADSKF